MAAAGKRTVLAAAALTLLVGVVAIGGNEPIRSTPGGAGETSGPPSVTTTVAPAREVRSDESSGLPGWLPWVIAAVVLGGLVAHAVLLVRLLRRRGGRRRRPGAPEPDEDEEDPAGALREDEDSDVARRAVEAALAPLLDPADPRAAVIAAYARMEAVLAERELGRGAAEAPREYLARVLRERGMPELSLTTLTEMFEEARFSRHPIPGSAPGRARDELEHARAALTARGD